MAFHSKCEFKKLINSSFPSPKQSHTDGLIKILLLLKENYWARESIWEKWAMGWEKSNKQKQMGGMAWQDIIPLFFYYLTSESGYLFFSNETSDRSSSGPTKLTGCYLITVQAWFFFLFDSSLILCNGQFMQRDTASNYIMCNVLTLKINTFN